MGRLTGKVALVAGAGGGMGTSVPFLFAREGANVVIGARRLEPLEALAERMRPHLADGAGEVACAAGDGLTTEGWTALIDATVARFGQLDILYSNLGDA